jgi:hypothetical protein
MKKRTIYIFIIVLVLISMTACKKKDPPSSSLGNIKGTVLSNEGRDPIYGVKVEVASGSIVKKLETNQNGEYSTAVPAGNIVITASRAGYIAQKVTVVLEKNAQLSVTPILLVLEENAISIEGTATFAAGVPDWSANVYAEISIMDDGLKYADMETIKAGTLKTSAYRIGGLRRDRNYIISARAANLPGDAIKDGPNTQTNKSIIRKSEIADPEKSTFTINVGPETNALVAAIELYLANTGRKLNDDGVDADLDAIQSAADPRQRAIELSTTTVQGTIQDILGEPLGEATVVIVGSNPQKSTVSDIGNGTFAITEVPIRYQSVSAGKAPRYLTAGQDVLELVAGVPCNVTLLLVPNPAVITGDLNAAAVLMADNSSGALSGWLTDAFSYTFLGVAKDRATAIAELPAAYVAVYPGPDTTYQSIGGSKTNFSFGNDNWTMRRETTFVRCSYRASGTVQYGNKRWQLVTLTIENEVRLPKAPTALTVTGGDASADVGWTAPVPEDAEIDGYRIYRTDTATKPADAAVPIGSTGIGSSYLESSLTTGRYYYWVRSVDEYSGVEILSDYSLPKQVYVVNALETVQQFVAYALAREEDSMTGMLAADFKWMPVGALYSSTNKTLFVYDMLEQFGTTAPIACRWDLQLSDPAFSRSTLGGNTIIKVSGSLAGRFSDLYPDRTRRWLEVLETWEVSLIDGKLRYFNAGARELYPGAPTAFTCTNMSTLEEDQIVKLAWQKPNDPALAGYRIYRNEANDFSMAVEVANVTNPASTAHSVSYISGKQIYYWIVACDSYGEVSAPSTPVLTGVPNEIRELAENFLNASYREAAVDVKKYTTVDFYAYLLKSQYTLASYCNFENFGMPVAPPYELANYRVLNQDPAVSSSTGGDGWNEIRVSDDWLRYELTFIVKGGGTICTWSGISCTNIVVQIANVNDEWKVFAANFLN